MNGPVGSISGPWVLVCLVLLACVQAVLPAVLGHIVLYLAAAVAPTAILLGQQAGAQRNEQKQQTAAAARHIVTGVRAATVESGASLCLSECPLDMHNVSDAPLGGALPRPSDETSTPSSTPANTATAAGSVWGPSKGAASAPPCTGCSSSSSCPWHLHGDLSLNLWGQDSYGLSSKNNHNSRHSSNSGARSSIGYQLPAANVLDSPMFSFATSAQQAGYDMGRSSHAARGLLRSLSAPAAAASYELDRPRDCAGNHSRQDTAAAAHDMNSPSRGCSHLNDSCHDTACTILQDNTAPSAVPLVLPVQLSDVGQHQHSQQSDMQEPCTPQPQLYNELLAVLQQIQDDQQDQQPSCTSSHQATQQACAGSRHAQQLVPQQQQEQQEARVLPFIATTSRHTMCLRQPSFKHTSGTPVSSSFSGSVAAPLPSPAESPLARRLSQRDETGLPASPALAELIGSGGRQIRRGGSLDSRRAASSPGSTRSSLEVQQQHTAPWSSLQLRPMMHLLQQRELQLQQQADKCSMQEGSSPPWFKAYHLARCHTFDSSMNLSPASELSVEADEALHASLDGRDALSCSIAGGSSSKSPLRRLFTQRSSSACSSADGAAMAAAEASPHSGSVSVGGVVTPHRLSSNSSSNPPQEAVVVDAAACSPTAG